MASREGTKYVQHTLIPFRRKVNILFMFQVTRFHSPVTLSRPRSVNAKVMDLFLAHFADTLDQDAHAVMMCDGAGWHDERALTVPDNVTLALLPPYSPELNPVERVWLYLRERFLSLRVLDDTEAIIDACCQAWIDLIAEPDRMRTLCAYPWIMKVIS